MIGSAQSAHLVDSVILSRHTACLAPPNVAILRMYTSSESHFLLPAKRLALRMGGAGQREEISGWGGAGSKILRVGRDNS